jgi:cyclopropane fatty-acyl-phospholipid synthase-like methyltransferase
MNPYRDDAQVPVHHAEVPNLTASGDLQQAVWVVTSPPHKLCFSYDCGYQPSPEDTHHAAGASKPDRDQLGRLGGAAVTPAELATRAMRLSTQAGEVVADLLCGSGTTVLVARDLGRQAIGVEISEHCWEFVARRLAQGVLEILG